MNLKHLKNKYFIDSYAKLAKERKLRSRAWFKLKEMDEKEKIFFKEAVVVDLGSSPGGWTQYSSEKIGNKGFIFSCDIKPMNFIDKVEFFQGNCCNIPFQKILINNIKKKFI